MKIIRLVPILLTGVHRHKFVDNGAGSHTCSVCGGVFAHTFVVSPAGDRCRLCSGCGAAVAHSWQNGVCTVCGYACTHPSCTQHDLAHQCKICGVVEEHSYEFVYEWPVCKRCTVCGHEILHEDLPTQFVSSYTCPVCGYTTSSRPQIN